ncbi:hypothetical protein [Caproiciproducens faecalis]|uniref:C2H2-type domain-containing protein n=1 Tax=Caproiciproducens faecalis TaxID=2820301 RepID=A0ABS7DMT5_9FIRM|nr:hypothetical protein [Caproiciproducens faecalis]MBW7572598.1 hypothetical protein [Caproiciproducens faecalis]
MKLENGTDTCNCPHIRCERHGKCAECLEHHAAHKKYPPYCKRKSRAGRTKSQKENPPV